MGRAIAILIGKVDSALARLEQRDVRCRRRTAGDLCADDFEQCATSSLPDNCCDTVLTWRASAGALCDSAKSRAFSMATVALQRETDEEFELRAVERASAGAPHGHDALDDFVGLERAATKISRSPLTRLVPAICTAAGRAPYR
jgi:hypothetical protein